ncbi:dihydropteroate synthase [Cardiobacterium valvarum]|uniref:Dihydropteroate synthase n=1 Tax=Cardiobacterium valvarum TaxID=194702 RepID=A0A381E2U2_9GAMM|nr:dihydropteroate synthase [Cardiobacterium valvarum]SUX20449.1 Dihydropteroate synthase [Cardiobacterium valvarum]
MRCGRYTLDLSKTNLMGVLNCTPDSFSDGGRYLDPTAALARARQMRAEGVDIIDIGAESTRPGAQEVPAEEEIARLTPIVRTLVADGQCPISIDTKKTAVMAAMLELGVDLINDVHGLEDDGAPALLTRYPHVAICLMHMRGMPDTMQQHTDYTDVVSEVDAYLKARVNACLEAGISADRLILDPGFGFGKTPAQNMALIRDCRRFSHERYPVLIGVSRKSTIGYYLDNAPVDARLYGSISLAALAAWQGAAIIRAHDIAATRDALRIANALRPTTQP